MLPKKFSLVLCLLPLVAAGPFANFRSGLNLVASDETDSWWQSASFYQIYPRSFKDTDGDGIGDLNGVTEKLPYLKELGITATWLSPIFQSPMVDFGYDISDYFKIHEEYGTMEDFERMVEKANELGIKVILDFVPNHSSNQNEWFKKSVNKEKGFENFYVWDSGKPNPENPDQPLPPTNWISIWRKSAWKWNSQRKQYYLHQFNEAQPDLNYRDPNVQEMMESVLKFWLDKGVHGFRVDAIPYAYECDPPKNEPRNNDVQDPEDYNYLKHTCTVDQDETLQLVYKWRKVLDDYTKQSKDKVPRIMMTEAYSPIDTVMKYYGSVDGQKQGSHIPFNFFLITDLNKTSNAKNFLNVINKWNEKMPKGRYANWVMGNHDQSRIASRIGVDKVDLMNMMLLSLRGAGITYNGEEIGMTDVWLSWKDTKDPAACNSNPNIYEKFTRDPVRTPFQWNDEKNAGFSTADKTWLPVSDNYKVVNVKRQENIARSTLNIYKTMQTLRKNKTFVNGNMQLAALSDNVLAIARSTGVQGTLTFVTLVNLGNKIEIVSLEELNNISNDLVYVLVNDKSLRNIGDKTSRKIRLSAYEGVVLVTTVPRA